MSNVPAADSKPTEEELEQQRQRKRERMLKSPKTLRYDLLEELGVFERMNIKRPEKRTGNKRVVRETARQE